MQSVYPSPEPILVNLLRLKKPIFCPALSVPCQQMRQKTEANQPKMRNDQSNDVFFVSMLTD
jgi:hypothetical protein